MNLKEYKFNEYTGKLNTYRKSDDLMFEERVQQGPEINRLIGRQVARTQVTQAKCFSELRDMELSDSFLEGFTLGK